MADSIKDAKLHPYYYFKNGNRRTKPQHGFPRPNENDYPIHLNSPIVVAHIERLASSEKLGAPPSSPVPPQSSPASSPPPPDPSLTSPHPSLSSDDASQPPVDASQSPPVTPDESGDEDLSPKPGRSVGSPRVAQDASPTSREAAPTSPPGISSTDVDDGDASQSSQIPPFPNVVGDLASASGEDATYSDDTSQSSTTSPRASQPSPNAPELQHSLSESDRADLEAEQYREEQQFIEADLHDEIRADLEDEQYLEEQQSLEADRKRDAETGPSNAPLSPPVERAKGEPRPMGQNSLPRTGSHTNKSIKGKFVAHPKTAANEFSTDLEEIPQEGVEYIGLAPNIYRAAYDLLCGEWNENRQYVIFTPLFGWNIWDETTKSWQCIDQHDIVQYIGKQLEAMKIPTRLHGVVKPFQRNDSWIHLATWIKSVKSTEVPPESCNLISFSDCVLDVSTMETQPHSPPFDQMAPERLITKPKPFAHVPFPYRDDPMLLETLEFILRLGSYDPVRINLIRDALRDIFLRYGGKQLATFLAGAANSGKSTLFKLLRKVFGAAAGTIGLPVIHESFFLERIRYCRLILVDEVSQTILQDQQVETLNSLVSRGPVTVNRKFGSIEEVVINANLLLAGNVPSSLDSQLNKKNLGIARRFVLTPIDFTVPPSEINPNLFETVLKDFGPFLAWVMGGSELINIKGYAESISRFLVYRAEGSDDKSKDFLDWFTSCVRQYSGASTALGLPGQKNPPSGLYLHYKNKMQTAGIKPLSAHNFRIELQKSCALVGVDYTIHHTRDKTLVEKLVLDTDLLWDAAESLTVGRSPIVQQLFTAPVLTVKRPDGVTSGFHCGKYRGQQDIENARVVKLAQFGFMADQVALPLDKMDIVDHNAHAMPWEQDFMEVDEAQWERHLINEFERRELLQINTRHPKTFELLEPIVSRASDLCRVSEHAQLNWKSIIDNPNAFKLQFDYDLFCQNRFWEKHDFSGLPPHINWDKPYPGLGVVAPDVKRLMGFPLAGGLIISTLNGLGYPLIQKMYAIEQKRHRAWQNDPENSHKFIKWFTYTRKNFLQAFSYRYSLAMSSVYGRIMPICENHNGIVLSQGLTSFKHSVIRAMHEMMGQPYDFWSFDLQGCHANLFCGFFADQATEFADALDTGDLWRAMALKIPNEAIPDAAGENFYWTKKSLKIFTYTVLQGGSPFNCISENEPLKHIFPNLPSEALLAKGKQILEFCPAIMNLTLLQDAVKPMKEIYLPFTDTPFRFAIDKENRSGNQVPPYAIWEMQSLSPEGLPGGVKIATVPQKVSRVFTGNEIVLLTHLVALFAKNKWGLVLQYEFDGIQCLIPSGNRESIEKEINREFEPFALQFSGRKIKVVGELIAPQQSPNK